MKRIHYILTGLSFTIILLSVNRLASLTLGHLAPFEFLRWVDFNAMLTIPLISIVLYYLLKREILVGTKKPRPKSYALLSILLVCGIYFFGAGSGDHEVTNYLNTRFCGGGEVRSTICDIVRYNDDEFSHFIYYLGFVLMNVALILLEFTLPRAKAIARRDIFLITANSVFIALGIFANLAFEPTTLDIIVFSAVMVLSVFLLAKKRSVATTPIVYYFACSYVLGIGATLLAKIIMGLF